MSSAVTVQVTESPGEIVLAVNVNELVLPKIVPAAVAH
jgi:hypothetical protein